MLTTQLQPQMFTTPDLPNTFIHPTLRKHQYPPTTMHTLSQKTIHPTAPWLHKQCPHQFAHNATTQVPSTLLPVENHPLNTTFTTQKTLSTLVYSTKNHPSKLFTTSQHLLNNHLLNSPPSTPRPPLHPLTKNSKTTYQPAYLPAKLVHYLNVLAKICYAASLQVTPTCTTLVGRPYAPSHKHIPCSVYTTGTTTCKMGNPWPTQLISYCWSGSCHWRKFKVYVPVIPPAASLTIYPLFLPMFSTCSACYNCPLTPTKPGDTVNPFTRTSCFPVPFTGRCTAAVLLVA